MPKLRTLTSPAEIARCLRRDPALNAYALGDLDPFFWPYCRWYGVNHAGGELAAVALLYLGSGPTLLAFEARPAGRALLEQLVPLLPERHYAHLHPELVEVMKRHGAFDDHGLHDKMGLVRRQPVMAADDGGAARLGPAELTELNELYGTAYPENWFDERMLATGHYFGIRRQGRLVAVAGVHVVSEVERVAALGNVTTHPEQRRRGLARAVTAACCRSLLDAGVETIALNVESGNQPAIRCYRSLGFQTTASYREGWCSRGA